MELLLDGLSSGPNVSLTGGQDHFIEEVMKVLWVVPKWTLPVTDGARVATDSLL